MHEIGVLFRKTVPQSGPIFRNRLSGARLSRVPLAGLQHVVEQAAIPALVIDFNPETVPISSANRPRQTDSQPGMWRLEGSG